jgi:hypothetical protein
MISSKVPRNTLKRDNCNAVKRETTRDEDRAKAMSMRPDSEGKFDWEGDLTVELNLASALLRYLICNTAVKSRTKVNK